ncbi:MAG: DNA alkylation repair protein [Oscillospiraceae bacterium]|jgi:3-methyladenine DNA glycosylase AlkC|nr:DNA alkylation repair protein [Oscillospiraceae bacterium]
MAELWKDKLNLETVREFAANIKAVYGSFPDEDFVKSTVDETWNSLELMARGKRVTENLKKYLPSDYKEAISIMEKAIVDCDPFYKLCFPTYVELYGQDEENWDASMAAMELFTQYSTAEFAVRPFIINHEKRMMAQMLAWSKHENEHVRRLSSEGCRPALPWGIALNMFKKDPTPILPILEQLKADPSLYVRKSVANNINDISKTHPQLVAKLAKDWYGQNEYTNWIVKHACRTLLKKGNRDVLAIFGYHDANSVELSDFELNATNTSIGGDISFSFTVFAKETTKLRLEYGIDFVKSNGKRNRKIFQISESKLKGNTKKPYVKIHSFADLSTRKHYPGSHSITLIANGIEHGTLDFELEGS